MQKDIVRIILFKKEEGVELIKDIFEFGLSEWTLKSGHFGAEINYRLMDAYKQVANGEASKVEIQKVDEGGY